MKCVFSAGKFVVSKSLRGGAAGFSVGRFGGISLGSGLSRVPEEEFWTGLDIVVI